MKLALCLLVGAITSTIANAGYASNCLLKCSDKNEPVCGSNGVTYTNECLLNLANCESSEPITKVHEGGCINATTPLSPYEPPSCPDMCPAIYDPVCASNGLTYPSGCALGIASCQSGGAITYVSDGPCSDTESSPSSCSDKCIEVYRPVCGTDNVTYGNSCFLEFASCKNASISLAYEGACNANGNKDCETSDTSTASGEISGCPDVCMLIFDPVCGSDKITYSNSCFLAIASCKDPSITQVHEGACSTYGENETENTPEQETGVVQNTLLCPDICLAVYDPVCGSDGATYDNECNLNVTSCNHPELNLTKISNGTCPPLECKTAF